MVWLCGVDGFKKKWRAVLGNFATGEAHWTDLPFNQILDLPEKPAIITIDVPIGLPEATLPGGRTCDQLARHALADAPDPAEIALAYDHLIELGVPASSIVAYGESLGSAQAVRLATKRPIAAVVLEAPLTSTVDVGRTTYFWLPLRLLITDKYDNEHNIRSVTAPVLLLHGEKDTVIPVEMGWRVYRAANEPKRIEIFPEAAHYDLFDHGAWEKTQSFLASFSG
ncbi:MAG: DUF429 domain-containing protein [Alphaproteobacteria bacterium]